MGWCSVRFRRERAGRPGSLYNRCQPVLPCAVDLASGGKEILSEKVWLGAEDHLPTRLFACQARHHGPERIDVLKEHLQIRNAKLLAPPLEGFRHVLHCTDEQIGVG